MRIKSFFVLSTPIILLLSVFCFVACHKDVQNADGPAAPIPSDNISSRTDKEIDPDKSCYGRITIQPYALFNFTSVPFTATVQARPCASSPWTDVITYVVPASPWADERYIHTTFPIQHDYFYRIKYTNQSQYTAAFISSIINPAPSSQSEIQRTIVAGPSANLAPGQSATVEYVSLYYGGLGKGNCGFNWTYPCPE
jgi:hypothetical protein